MFEIALCGFVVAILIIGCIIARCHEKREWNEGYCKKTYRKWRHFDNDSQGGRGYTDDLGHYCWISYAVDK